MNEFDLDPGSLVDENIDFDWSEITEEVRVDLIVDDYKNKMFILQKISSLPELKEDDLKIYEDVTMKHLKNYFPRDERFPENVNLDLVICKDDRIKCCIMFKGYASQEYEQLQRVFPKEVAVLKFYNSLFMHKDTQNWLTKIQQSLHTNQPSLLLSTIAISKIIKSNSLNESQSNEILLQEVLTKTAKEYLVNENWTETITENKITAFGTDCGLIKQWFIDGHGELSDQIVCSEDSKQKLTDVLNWKYAFEKANPQKSFSERIQNLNNNRPSDETYLIKPLQKSANLPIKMFFRQMASELKELRGIIAAYDSELNYETYQEVATIIHDMFKDNFGRAEEAMLLLAKPYLHEYNRIKNNSKNQRKEWL